MQSQGSQSIQILASFTVTMSALIFFSGCDSSTGTHLTPPGGATSGGTPGAGGVTTFGGSRAVPGGVTTSSSATAAGGKTGTSGGSLASGGVVVTGGAKAGSGGSSTGLGTPTALCTGFAVGSTALVPYSPLPKPTLLQAVHDPDFPPSVIRRITDESEWPGNPIAVPAYPTIPVWNADESLMVLYVQGSGHVLLDGKTYQFKRQLEIDPPDLEHYYWDTHDPDILYFVSNLAPHVLNKYHVSTKTSDVLHTFDRDLASGGQLASACAGYDTYGAVSGGEDPFFISYDNDLFGLGCKLNHNGPNGASAFVGFSYRVSTDQIGNTIPNEATVPQASASGRLVYFYGTQGTQILDPMTHALLRSLPWSGEEHSDLLLNAKGEDVVAGPQYDGPSGSGTLLLGNLMTGKVTTIIGPTKTGTDDSYSYPPSGTLVSGKAFKNPGWVVVGVTGEIDLTHTYLDQEIILANVDTGDFCRVAHHRSTGNWYNATESNYWAQPNVVFSPSGTRVAFPSDWGAANPGPSVKADPNASVDVYVLELPGYQP